MCGNYPAGISAPRLYDASMRCNDCGDTWDVSCIDDLGHAGPQNEADTVCQSCYSENTEWV